MHPNIPDFGAFQPSKCPKCGFCPACGRADSVNTLPTVTTGSIGLANLGAVEDQLKGMFGPNVRVTPVGPPTTTTTSTSVHPGRPEWVDELLDRVTALEERIGFEDEED